MHNCDNCEILTIVAMLSWTISALVTVPGDCNWIELWSMGVLRFFWMWKANYIQCSWIEFKDCRWVDSPRLKEAVLGVG